MERHCLPWCNCHTSGSLLATRTSTNTKVVSGLRLWPTVFYHHPGPPDSRSVRSAFSGTTALARVSE